MKIIVAGKIAIKSGARDEFVNKSQKDVLLARNDESCEDFSVSPDPIDPNRVNVFEKWKSRSALDDFRSAGGESDLFSLAESFDIREYEINE